MVATLAAAMGLLQLARSRVGATGLLRLGLDFLWIVALLAMFLVVGLVVWFVGVAVVRCSRNLVITTDQVGLRGLGVRPSSLALRSMGAVYVTQTRRQRLLRTGDLEIVPLDGGRSLRLRGLAWPHALRAELFARAELAHNRPTAQELAASGPVARELRALDEQLRRGVIDQAEHRWRSGRALAGWDVFLAYAGGDRAPAQVLFEALTAAGARVCFDQDVLRPGDDWHDLLPRYVRASRVVVVLVSSRTPRAHYQRSELIGAIDHVRASGNRLVPVRLEPGAVLPYGTEQFQAIDLLGPDTVDDVARQIVALVQHSG
jgi:hypothetical protein